MKKKYRIGNVHLFIENKDCSYRYTWMTLTWLERSRIWLPRGRNGWKNGDLDEPTSSWPRFFGMYSTWMWTERYYFWAIHRYASIANFCWRNWKITRMGKTSHKDGCVVLRHGRTCSKMHWEILRTGKQKDKAAVQGFEPSLWWSSIKEELESIRELSKESSQIVLKCSYLARTGRLDILWSV